MAHYSTHSSFHSLSSQSHFELRTMILWSCPLHALWNIPLLRFHINICLHCNKQQPLFILVVVAYSCSFLMPCHAILFHSIPFNIISIPLWLWSCSPHLTCHQSQYSSITIPILFQNTLGPQNLNIIPKIEIPVLILIHHQGQIQQLHRIRITI